MAITLAAIFEDGKEEPIRDFDDFHEAVAEALDLADSQGSDAGDGSGPPRLLRVYRGGRIEFSIRVIRGGLTNADPIRRKADQG